MQQSPRKKIGSNNLQITQYLSHLQSSQNKSLSDSITNFSSQDSSSQLKKEEFKTQHKTKFQLESEMNQHNLQPFLNDQNKLKRRQKLMQIKITNNGNSIDGDSTNTLQFMSKIIDEDQLLKKQALQKTYQNSIYSKLDSYSFKTFLNIPKVNEAAIKSASVLGSNSSSNALLTVGQLSSNQLYTKSSSILPSSITEVNDIQSGSLQSPNLLYNRSPNPQTPKKKYSFQTSIISNQTNSSIGMTRDRQKSLKIIDDQRILQGSIQQVSYGFLTQRRNHSTTQLQDSLIQQVPPPPMKTIVSHNAFIRGQLGKRQDALQVKGYLEIKIKELLQKDPLTKEDLFILRQNIYSSCLEEIIRQIATDCKERAVVLQEIWDSTMELMTNLFVFLEKQKLNIERDLSKNISELHQKYQRTLNEDIGIIHKQQDQISDRDAFIEKQISENRYLRKKDKKMEKLYKISQNQINYLQDELNSSIREHLKYLMSHEELTWREALEYQRKYFELTKSKRTSAQKNIKEITQQIHMHLNQNEILQHIVIVNYFE